ncbi:DNA (cytosine-5)-methyltransferase 1 [Propionicimonas paludicola]|uniref:DNA (cytosine-5-)-methyltransferase n=1 Tax=Propionicimonas paludicola TaxID=185243 RepID=A0A2A9CRZ4_9ACTN|nr:DNA cytosine methyltransferase [Propionicimonas paludicola]PFG17217.1 DNA (cytosine-5)-methyltransferase 1 [Propionicimonas paludicola]
MIRACEIHQYEAVMIENVVEAAAWELFDIWLSAMAALGYEVQFISVSAAHVGGEANPHAPQWRDRLYMVFTRKGVRKPDVEPRPLAWCPKCDANVAAVQWWKKPGRHIGKYRQQYIYVCPVGNHGQVEPYVAPAAAAIDWTDLGIRIGDRVDLGMRPLAGGTLRRIEAGLRMVSDPVMVAAAGNTYDAATGKPGNYLRADDPRVWPFPTQATSSQTGIATKFVMATNHDTGARAFDPDCGPLPTRSTKNGEAIIMAEPFVTMLRRNGTATPIGDPLQTFSAGGFHHGLTVPAGAMLMSPASGGKAKPVTEPTPALVTTTRPMLVIPYRKGARPHSLAEPLSTQATHESHGLMAGQVSVEDCYFRMLHPRESANAQRFPADYIITGNRGEQQMQAGNAVAVNVAQWLGGQVAEALSAA